MARTLMVLAVVSIWGCASSTPGGVAPASGPDVRVVTAGGEKVLATGNTAVVEGVATVAAPIDKVWAGPSADSYEINLQVTTSLAPASSAATVVTTRVNAAGKPASLSGEYMPCSTTGGLETRLVRLIEAQVK